MLGGSQKALFGLASTLAGRMLADWPAENRSAKDECGGPSRVRRSEYHRHRRALRQSHESRALGVGRLHDGLDVLDPFLEKLGLLQGVRQPGAALVEEDQPREGGQSLEEARARRLRQEGLDVRDETGYEDEI